MPGTLPNMTRAEASCTRANRVATLASHTFTVSGLEKPARFTAMPVGVCSRPYRPSVIETTAPIDTGTSTFARLAIGPGADGPGVGERGVGGVAGYTVIGVS